MSTNYRRLIGVAVLLQTAAAAHADTGSFSGGIDIQAEHAHQEFANDSANVNTIDIAPYLQRGNWELSLDAPWVSADANYVNNRFPSRLVTACSDPTAIAANYPKLAARLAAKLASYCESRGVLSPGDTVSGFSDITAFARYGMLLDERGIWLLSLGAGYKFDNGDVDQNLGSGTRNTLLEASLGANYGIFFGSLTSGYAFVAGGDEFTDSHYSYALLDLGVNPKKWLALGCTIDYEQTYYQFADDVTKVTAYVRFKPFRHVRFKLYTTDYGSAEGYPEREYGGSMAYVY